MNDFMIENEYWFVIDGKRIPNEESMLAKLLDEDVLFCNSRKFVDPFNKEVMEETIVLFLNCNDCFGPGADSDCLTLNDLPGFFSLYEKIEDWATVEFVAKKRKMQPRKRLKEKMISQGVWNPELDVFPENKFN
jgi:hypothetical protein